MKTSLAPIFALAALILTACSSSEPTVELTLSESQLETAYAKAVSMSSGELQMDFESMQAAEWLYSKNCSSCHQANAKGGVGIPDLTDQNWLFEGTEASIRQTITQGRIGVMPEFSSSIGEVELGLLVSYVESLSQTGELNASEASGKPIYEKYCVACHGIDGSGFANLGPSLKDDQWQWGGNMITIRKSISTGRTTECPAQQSVLTPEQISLLTAYVLKLSS